MAEREVARKVKCGLCGREVAIEDARMCRSCRRVVCKNCFDIPMGVCKDCVSKFSVDGPCPDYIA